MSIEVTPENFFGFRIFPYGKVPAPADSPLPLRTYHSVMIVSMSFLTEMTGVSLSFYKLHELRSTLLNNEESAL